MVRLRTTEYRGKVSIDEAIFDAINEFDKRCPYCSKDLYMGGIREKIEIDHFIPVSKGGSISPGIWCQYVKTVTAKNGQNYLSTF